MVETLLFSLFQEIKIEDETEDTEDDHDEDPLQTSSVRIKQESILSSSGPTLIKQVTEGVC